MMYGKIALVVCAGLLGQTAGAETRTVFLESGDGSRLEIASVDVAEDGTYRVAMNDAAFADHFLSMRPFKCLESEKKHWCHVPYPYEIRRDISDDLVDMEYDFLFVWKGATEYGINMWNGVYYRLETTGDKILGVMHEMDMNQLAVPPAAGELRPVKDSDLHESDADSHWLPRLVIE